MVPGRHMRDTRADGLHDPRALVPEHDRRRERDGPVDDRQIAVAQPRGRDVDEHLPRPRIAHLEIVDHVGPDPVEHDTPHDDSLVSLGSPSTRSAMMLRWISSEPP